MCLLCYWEDCVEHVIRLSMGKINLRWQTIIFFFFEVAPDALYLKFCVNPGFKEMAVGFVMK